MTQQQPHSCIRCRWYSDICDLCYGSGRRARVECHRCAGTGEYIRHAVGCLVGALPLREFTRERAVQARMAI